MADQRLAAVNAALEQAAETLGDITPLVMAEFFRHHPEARDSFAHHSPHNPARLEAEMVDNALYCLMTWCERRQEVEIILQTSVEHHADTLKVPVTWYNGLIDATVAVLAGANDDPATHALWEEVRGELTGAVVAAS